MTFEVIPAIDVRGGRCVRLHQGDYARETVFDDDPLEVARRWLDQGATRIHVVDLDGAREGQRVNAPVVEGIARLGLERGVPVQTGGGIRDLETVRALLDAGLDRVALGTAAVGNPELVRAAVALAPERVFVSVDARDGIVRTAGWVESSGLDALAFVRELEGLGVRRIVFTDIARDGVLDGPNVEAYARLARETSMAIVAAGGVTRAEDVRALAATGIEGAIIGRALYTGDITLHAAMEAARDASASVSPSAGGD